MDILWSKGEQTHVNSHFPNFFFSGDFFLEEKQTEPDYLTLASLSLNQFLENVSHTAPTLNYFSIDRKD